MKKRYLLLGLLFLFILTAATILRPVPILPESEQLIVQGKVIDIYEGGAYDAVFRLENNKTKYYINRGLENNLNLEELKAELLNNEVTIKYPPYWTPLDHNETIRHLSKLEFGEKVIFDETKK